MSSDADDEIELVIENQSIKCNKSLLVDNSDYFKVMLEGNFKERNATTLNLQGIVFETMRPILILLCDDTYILEFDEMLGVLKTACILQFERIRDNLVARLTEILTPRNCIKIWFTAELLDLRQLYLKAKNLALIEFDMIKDLDCLEELDLVQLHSYLSNIYLKCKSEMDVFNVCMRWFFENRKNAADEDDCGLIISLFSCIDFRNLSCEDIHEMMLFPNIAGKQYCIDILKCILIKKGKGDNYDYGDTVVKKVESLLGGEARNKDCCDVLFFVKTFNELRNVVCFSRDDYQRKRKYYNLENGVVEDIPANEKQVFNKYLDIPKEKFEYFEGFQILGYKEQIFLFGGESLLGSGSWNLNLWAYDSIREKWERRTKLPFGRRHFESCICGNNLYIIGGTGAFRVIQDNMFFYNHKDNDWSKLITLPAVGRFLKCCNYKEQLFLLNLTNLCGYLFVENKRFIELKIIDKDNVLASNLKTFSLFTCNNHIILKGSIIIEMEVVGNEIRIVKHEYLKEINCDSMESVVCRNKVYTLFKNNLNQRVELEIFCLKTYTSFVLFESSETDLYEIENDKQTYYINKYVKLFTMQDHNKLSSSTYINKLQ